MAAHPVHRTRASGTLRDTMHLNKGICCPSVSYSRRTVPQPCEPGVRRSRTTDYPDLVQMRSDCDSSILDTSIIHLVAERWSSAARSASAGASCPASRGQRRPCYLAGALCAPDRGVSSVVGMRLTSQSVERRCPGWSSLRQRSHRQACQNPMWLARFRLAHPQSRHSQTRMAPAG